MDFGVRQAWMGIRSLPLSSRVPLGNVLKPLSPSFPSVIRMNNACPTWSREHKMGITLHNGRAGSVLSAPLVHPLILQRRQPRSREGT